MKTMKKYFFNAGLAELLVARFFAAIFRLSENNVIDLNNH
jgi:hypothetical protein